MRAGRGRGARARELAPRAAARRPRSTPSGRGAAYLCLMTSAGTLANEQQMSAGTYFSANCTSVFFSFSHSLRLMSSPEYSVTTLCMSAHGIVPADAPNARRRGRVRRRPPRAARAGAARTGVPRAITGKPLYTSLTPFQSRPT